MRNVERYKEHKRKVQEILNTNGYRRMLDLKKEMLNFERGIPEDEVAFEFD